MLPSYARLRPRKQVVKNITIPTFNDVVRDCIIFKSIQPATSKAAFRNYCIFVKDLLLSNPHTIWRDLGLYVHTRDGCNFLLLDKYLVWTLATHCCSSRSWFPRQTCIAILTLKYELAQSRSTINFYRFKQNKSALSGTFVRAETHPPTLMLVPVTCACVHELSEVPLEEQLRLRIFSFEYFLFFWGAKIESTNIYFLAKIPLASLHSPLAFSPARPPWPRWPGSPLPPCSIKICCQYCALTSLPKLEIDSIEQICTAREYYTFHSSGTCLSGCRSFSTRDCILSSEIQYF